MSKSLDRGPLRGTKGRARGQAPRPRRGLFRGQGLSPAQVRRFRRQGYLTIENALSPALLNRVRRAVDRIYGRVARQGKLGDGGHLFYTNCVVEDDSFLQLMENPKTFPMVWDLLGWNIFLYHSHLNVTPPLPRGTPAQDRTLGWHQDSGRVNHDLGPVGRPGMSLKIAYWLTDLPKGGQANMWVIPGRHRNDKLRRPRSGFGQPRGAIPLKARAGWATIFDRRTWHAASSNLLGPTRKVVFMGYAYRWMRSKDNSGHPAAYLDRMDPIQKQLLGDSPYPNARFTPGEEDAVPLVRAIRRVRGPKAVGALPFG